jgi:2-polyprenyl-3-methyl-5-hydroxy-6-metoxy-1,4-benzoquinol methylase
MVCNNCKSSKVKKKFDITAQHQIWFCLNCNVQFLYPQLNEIALQKLYSENYYKAWGIEGEADNQITKKMKIATFQLRIDLIRHYINKGKVLDVGCATGYFLEIAQKNGFEVFGVEFSNYSSTIAQKMFGEKNIFCGTIEQCGFVDDNFDVITMSDLIEHVRIPSQTLLKASALLKKDGLIMIMTPDHDSLSNYMMGKRWIHYKLEHFFYFNRKSINYTASSCGLELIHYERSQKALNIDYLHTQLNVYKHWLMTPLCNILQFVLPKKITAKNFYIAIGEMVVILKKKKSNV